MEVILKQDIDKLGQKDDIVKVRDGFGRNYLLPRGFAILATPSGKIHHAEITRQKSKKEERLKDEALKTAEILNTITVQVGAKVSPTGKIFGSITTIQLSEELGKKGLVINRKQITLNDEDIKEVGNYMAKVKVYKGVDATLHFEVVKE